MILNSHVALFIKDTSYRYEISNTDQKYKASAINCEKL